MTRFAVLAGAVAVLAAVAACSSSGTSNPPAGGSTTTLHITVSHGHLVDTRGRTLYSNTADTPTHLICTGSCLRIWPPVLGRAGAGAGLSAGDFSTVRRGRSTQVTYQGHPLYEFASDTKAGDEKGAGLSDQGGTWQPAGASASPTPGGGGGGYGGH
jgi:predicted lipoprotein with Yx(FWY)xxD motif